MKRLYWYSLSALVVFLSNCTGSDKPADTSPQEKPIPTLSYSILSDHPHDTSYFTEGLEFYNNTLLESTGLNEKSRLVQYDLATGKVAKQVTLDPKLFGEGITVLHDTLYQLTYQEHVVNVYTAKDFKKIKEFQFNGEGWGLTNDGKNLIATNGSSNLYFYDPSTFKVIREQTVTENGVPAVNLNEVEYVNGFVYANQWQYNYILKINPANGEVVAKMDLSDLVNKIRQDNHSEFLNGIAYNHATNKFYITGKLWPRIYEIQFDR
jgi:glutamine cyclotransferase